MPEQFQAISRNHDGEGNQSMNIGFHEIPGVPGDKRGHSNKLGRAEKGGVAGMKLLEEWSDCLGGGFGGDLRSQDLPEPPALLDQMREPFTQHPVQLYDDLFGGNHRQSARFNEAQQLPRSSFRRKQRGNADTGVEENLMAECDHSQSVLCRTCRRSLRSISSVMDLRRASLANLFATDSNTEGCG